MCRTKLHVSEAFTSTMKTLIFVMELFATLSTYPVESFNATRVTFSTQDHVNSDKLSLQCQYPSQVDDTVPAVNWFVDDHLFYSYSLVNHSILYSSTFAAINVSYFFSHSPSVAVNRYHFVFASLEPFPSECNNALTLCFLHHWAIVHKVLFMQISFGFTRSIIQRGLPFNYM